MTLNNIISIILIITVIIFIIIGILKYGKNVIEGFVKYCLQDKKNKQE